MRRLSLEGDEHQSPNQYIRTISSRVNKLKQEYRNRQLLGIGIATPGYVDPASGDVLSIGRAPHWPNFPLRARLEAEIGLPVVVENDIDCMTLAEMNGGEAGGEDLLYIGFIEGVKASMYLNGRLYKGPFGNAGLIGHTTVLPEPLAPNTAACVKNVVEGNSNLSPSLSLPRKNFGSAIFLSL